MMIVVIEERRQYTEIIYPGIFGYSEQFLDALSRGREHKWSFCIVARSIRLFKESEYKAVPCQETFLFQC